jgi:hypothetical protein
MAAMLDSIILHYQVMSTTSYAHEEHGSKEEYWHSDTKNGEAVSQKPLAKTLMHTTASQETSHKSTREESK